MDATIELFKYFDEFCKDANDKLFEQKLQDANQKVVFAEVSEKTETYSKFTYGILRSYTYKFKLEEETKGQIALDKETKYLVYFRNEYQDAFYFGNLNKDGYLHGKNSLEYTSRSMLQSPN